MTCRHRFVVSLLALALAAPAVPATARSESRSLGEILADGMSDAAAAIGSMQDEIAEMAPGVDPSDPEGEIDPSDPDGEVDPGSPDEGDDVEPGAIDPSDPDANPGDPIDPTEPEDDVPDGDEGEGGSEGSIELPVPSEPEEGGYFELQLLPEPAPRAGRWTVVNHPGRMTCTGAGSIRLKRTQQRTRLKVLEDGRVLKGPRLAPDAGNLKMTWQPESEAYTGVVRVAAPGGATKIRFYLRVVNPGKLRGEMVATVNVDASGVKSSCAGSRKITLTRN